MSIIWSLLVGIAAGWLSGQIMKGRGFGVLGNLIIGVIGSFVGSALFAVVGLSAYGIIGNLLMSTVGAVALIYILTRIRT
ncbi:MULTISPECIES: GlsB/YeaQ/YmgE family stress response membrane protein [unclassified Schlesneria]|uniref:GlsB/YeaQ/YmgE family stress response membrane protein n=1 Tax=Schlesneria TaxID=656899 RepID=UPI002EE3F9E7